MFRAVPHDKTSYSYRGYRLKYTSLTRCSTTHKMFEKIVYNLDITSVLIVAVFFLLLEYRPPWWCRPQNEINKGIKLIPGPYSLPIIGTSWVVAIGGYGLNQLHKYYRDMHVKYGSVMKEEAFCNIPVINLFEKRDIEKVLRNSGKYPLRPPAEAVAHYRASRPDRYSSIGLVNEQGLSWHFLRSVLTPSLMSPRTMSSFQPELASIADDWCNLIKQMRNESNQIHNFETLVDRLALELTCALVLGRRMGFLIPGEESSVAKALGDAVRQHFLSTRDTYFGLPFWKIFPTPSYKRLIQSEEAIYQLAVDLIKTADDSTKESAVFQSVMSAPIHEKEKIAAIVDFISAGIHTMKNSYLFLVNDVGQCPEMQEKILEDSSKTYAKACMMESFRLHPTANSLGRILDREMELGGYRLDAGTVVVCHSGLACRNQENFNNAEEYLPERWIENDKLKTSSNSTFIVSPFGAGKRICPGKRFVETTLPSLLESIAKSFKITSQPLQVQFEFLLTPKSPITVTFEDRV